MIRYKPSITQRLSRLFSSVQDEQVAVFIGRVVGSDYYLEDIIPAVNESFDCRTHFFISNRQINRLMIKAQRNGMILLGVAHSHPDTLPAAPSQADISNCHHAVNAVFQPSSGRLTFFDACGITQTQVIEKAPRWVFVPSLSRA